MAELRIDFKANDHPEWRRSSVSTSEMVDAIVKYCQRYKQLPDSEKGWVKTDLALAEFLHQVNKIEQEGFSTYQETRDQIEMGVLKQPKSDVVPLDDLRLEHLCSLHKALGHWFKLEGEERPRFCIQELEKSHKLLLGATQASISGRIRRQEHEVVFTNTEDGLLHVFMWPTEVEVALERLFAKTEMLLAEMQQFDFLEFCRSGVERLLNLGASFFLEFETIHPFLDGNGRLGRILLACIFQPIMPFPNVLLVDRPDYGQPPFIAPIYYYDCLQDATVHSSAKPATQSSITKESSRCTLGYPKDLAALLIEGVYVAWKRYFTQLEKDRNTNNN